MSLVTRCAACATSFRVQRAQLAARGGKVRCGKCGTVFDGVANLVEEEGGEVLDLEPSPQFGLFDPSRRPALGPAELPEFLQGGEEAPRRRLLWGALVLASLALLAGQLAFLFRTELALLAPETRPALESACGLLRCEVRLPRRPELMSIESSDLQADPRRKDIIVLNAVIRNRAPFPQEYPALELTLTDEADRVVVRRVLRPVDYVEGGRVVRGIAGGGEGLVRVNFDARLARATGYRLYLFYPS